MITLYCTRDCPLCAEVREALDDLAFAHRVVVVTGKAELPEPVRACAMPVLDNNGEIVAGPRAIFAHLRDQEGFREEWYRFQSDACYCKE